MIAGRALSAPFGPENHSASALRLNECSEKHVGDDDTFEITSFNVVVHSKYHFALLVFHFSGNNF